MKTLLSGNEAIARGAYEYGVQVATGYPGTPSSEILENIARYDEIYSEWSVNEKVAMDVAVGAAYAGQRAVVTMKQVGMNVAADSFFYPVYTGVKGGLLIVTADDPGMFSSQNEQDNRHYARFAKMPMLEPSNSQEAKDFVGIGLDLSEEWDTPVLLRTVMRVSHSASPVELGERRADDTAPSTTDGTLASGQTPTPPLERNPRKLVSTCLWARERHPVVEARLKELAERASTYPFNRLEWGESPHSRLGIVASGPVYHYAREIWPEASFLKLGLTYPLPTALVREFAAGVEELLVVEELDPFLEEQIALLLKSTEIACRGKDIFPACGELTTPVIERSAAKAGILPREAVKGERQVAPSDLPGRPPVFCPGCPHRSTFYILSKMKDVVVAGDIGCYNLGALPPFNATDTMGAMGASVGVAHGFDVAGIPDRFVAVIGDSTFFHAGVAPLLNIVHNGGKSTVVILDNQTTAMTGHQDHPGVGVKLGGEPVTKVEIEDIVRASGVTDVHKVSAFDVQAVEGAFEQALAFDGPSVVIVEGPCFFVGPGTAGAYVVDGDACTACGQCFRMGCPAIVRSEEMHVKTGKPKAKIDPVLCVGCDMCAQICSSEAIHPSTRSERHPTKSEARPRQSANLPICKSAIRNPQPAIRDPLNFLITGVGGQGTVLASDIMAAVGLAAGYDVKKSDILGLAVRGGGVVGHVRWGEQVHSPIVPEGRVDYLVAFEVLEGLRWLNQMRPEGAVLINQQEIHPVTVSSGVAVYPDGETAESALRVAAEQVYRIPGLGMAQELGHARVLNVVLLGALSALLPVEPGTWESVLKERVPPRFVDLNLRAFHTGREWLRDRLVGWLVG